jgi:hypothetical protein
VCVLILHHPGQQERWLGSAVSTMWYNGFSYYFYLIDFFFTTPYFSLSFQFNRQKNPVKSYTTGGTEETLPGYRESTTPRGGRRESKYDIQTPSH